MVHPVRDMTRSARVMTGSVRDLIVLVGFARDLNRVHRQADRQLSFERFPTKQT
jgi:hypothetical protein